MLGVVDSCRHRLRCSRKVFADEAIEQGAQHVLLEVPAIDGTAHIVGDMPDLALQGGALFVACHFKVLFRFVEPCSGAMLEQE
jgi:hypothetical protein